MCPFNIIIDLLVPFQFSSIMFYIFFSLISSCNHDPIYDGEIETLSGLLPCMESTCFSCWTNLLLVTTAYDITGRVSEKILGFMYILCVLCLFLCEIMHSRLHINFSDSFFYWNNCSKSHKVGLIISKV